MQEKLFISSKEYDFLKSPHRIKTYKIKKIKRKTCLICELEDKITVWQNNNLYVFGEVLLVDRIWLKSGIKKLKKFPIQVHIIDWASVKNNSLENAFNIAWGYLDKI